MSRFIENCVLIDSNISIEEISNSDNLWELVKDNSSETIAFYVEYIVDNESEYLSCSGAASALELLWTAEIESQMVALYKKEFGIDVENYTAISFMTNFIADTNNLFINSAKDSNEIIKQNLMISAFKNTDIGMSEYADIITAIETQNTFQRAAAQATSWLPLARTAIEAMLYGVFPFVFLLFLLPMGVKIFSNYLQALIWLQAWPPLYAVLHLIVTLYNQQVLLPFDQESVKMMNYGQITSAQEDLSYIAGYLMLMIPFLATKLLQGFSGIGHMLGSMTGALQGAGSSSVSEMTRGNYSQGNVSYNNVGANKLDTRDHSFRYGSTSDNTDLSVTKTDGHGHQYMDTSAKSSLFHTKIDQNTSMKEMIGNRYDQSLRNAESKQESAQEIETQNTSNVLEFVMGEQSNISNNTGWAKNMTEDQRNAVEAVQSYASSENLSFDFGLGTFLKGGKGYQVSDEDRKALSEHMEVLSSISSNESFSKDYSEQKSLLDNISTNYTESQALQKESAQLTEKAESIAAYRDTLTEESFNINTDLTTLFANSLQGKGYSNEEISSLMDNEQKFLQRDELLEEFKIDLADGHLKEVGFYDNKKAELEEAGNAINGAEVGSIKDSYSKNKEEMRANSVISDKLDNSNLQEEYNLRINSANTKLEEGVEDSEKGQVSRLWDNIKSDITPSNENMTGYIKKLGDKND